MVTRIGIDTGGTFTDVVSRTGRGLTVHKLRSTPDDPARAVLAGIAAVRRSVDESVDVVHGTTVGLNAVLTGNLARTVFVTNRDCEDLIEVGRQQRDDLYALAPHRAVPPVPRALRVGVDCRRAADGAPVRVLSAREITRTVAKVRRLRPESVAIGLLHAPTAPDDELRLAAALREVLPGMPITTSAGLLPVLGEYERFTAAILNAAIAPIVGRYTRRIAEQIGNGSLRLLRSSLGILPPAEAAEYPARALLSGPAGGVLATRQLLAGLGCSQVAAFDMGGTSADVCLVTRDLTNTERGTIAGLPLAVPGVPVHTVGCGGGSIAYVDAGGALRVGPESAGADPGPACYGKGTDPTVTDAHVALGHLGAESLLAGELSIDVDAAVRAIERLARKLGMQTRAAAEGILTVADATMARAILAITAERAVDPANVPLVAYGGAGGLHAASLVGRLGMPNAVVPMVPGAFSAVGLAISAETREFLEPVSTQLSAAGLRKLHERARSIAATLRAGMSRAGRVLVGARLRYEGQGATLQLPLGKGLGVRFAREHERQFGFVANQPIEVRELIVRVEQAASTLGTVRFESVGRIHSGMSRRPPIGGPTLRVHHRSLCPPVVTGPAILEEATGTTWVPAGYVASSDSQGIKIRTAASGRRRS